MRTKKRDLKNIIKELRQKINEKCMDCMCYQIKEIKLCTVIGCSLHSLRPVSHVGLLTIKRKNAKAEAKKSSATPKRHSKKEVV
jgi:hypothetical protein